MSRKRTTSLALLTLILFSASLLMGCAKPAPQPTTAEPERRAESTPILPPQKSDYAQALISPTPTPPKPAPLPPPTIDQIRDAVARVFAKTATPDTSLHPGYVVGDFNGDGFEDLAVAVKVGEGYLGEINNELANWVLEDPRNVATRTATTPMPPGKPARAEKGDTLLAIIHGVGAQGWRAPEAKQTFLLKNGAGSNMLVKSPEGLRSAKGDPKLPLLKGDIINETTGNGSGLVFWTGAKYAWYSSSRD
jgi:FG-GAP repeat